MKAIHYLANRFYLTLLKYITINIMTIEHYRISQLVFFLLFKTKHEKSNLCLRISSSMRTKHINGDLLQLKLNHYLTSSRLPLFVSKNNSIFFCVSFFTGKSYPWDNLLYIFNQMTYCNDQVCIKFSLFMKFKMPHCVCTFNSCSWVFLRLHSHRL